MKNGSKLFALAIALIIAATTRAQTPVALADEDLTYAVMYKWGLINKQAGEATLSLRSDPEHYRAQMAARTLPWADKVYKVRDTLQSVMLNPGYVPKQYVKISHEGGSYSYNRLDYTEQGDMVTADVVRHGTRKNGTTFASDTTLCAQAPGVDMLSVFYYIRLLDFPSMKAGQTVVLNVFSGKKVERLTITYGGVQTIQVANKKRRTYQVTFTFTHNGQESDYPMYSWISQDAQRIPLKLEGTLPLGKVQAFYTGTIPD